METTGFIDLFATKGIEYLMVIGFLLVFIIFWRILNRARVPVPATAAAGGTSPAPSGWFGFAEDRYYHQGHTWAKPAGGDLFTVGLDDFAQKLVGPLSSLRVPAAGTRLEQGETGWKLLVGDRAVNVVSPLGGEIVEVNREVMDSPSILNSDPYGKGWLMKVRTPQRKRNLRNLISGSLARSWMDDTESILRGKISGELGLVLQDGGVPVSGIARELSPDRWQDVVREFLISE